MTRPTLQVQRAAARRRVAALAALVFVAPALAAQQAPAGAVPAALAPTLPRDSAFITWLTARGPAKRPVWPSRLEHPAFTLLLEATTARRVPPTTAQVDSVLARCADLLFVQPQERQRLAAGTGLSRADDRVAPALMLTVVPADSGWLRACESEDTDRIALVEAGLRPLRAMPPARRLQAVVLEVDGAEQRPLAGRRAPIVTGARGGEVDSASAGLRYFFPIDAVAPFADGSLPQVTVAVYTEGQPGPIRLELPASAVRRALEATREWRVARATDAPVSQPLQHPRPNRESLREAVAALGEGRTRVALTEILNVESGPRLAKRDRLVAAQAAAEGFLALGDTAAARLSLMRSYAVDPCVRVGAANPSPLSALSRPLPLHRECVPLGPVPHYALPPLVPGIGQMLYGPGVFRRMIGIGAALITASHLQRGLQVQDESRDLYAQYRRTLNSTTVVPLYALARERQDVANALLTDAAILWTAATLEHVAFHAWRNYRLRKSPGYGSRGRVR